MRNLLNHLVILVVLSPYILAFVPNPDSSLTTVEIGAGFGSYTDVSRNCQGDVVSVRQVPFSDVGVSVRHQTSNVRFGVAGGSTTGDRRFFGDLPEGQKDRIWFVNPNAGLNYRDFGMDLGYVIPLNDYSSSQLGYSDYSVITTGFPSLKFRFAPVHGPHLTLGFASNLPLLTGGGLAELGMTFPLSSPASTLGIGLAGYPWDRTALSVKSDFPLVNNLGMGLRGQIGLGGEGTEYGMAVVGRLRF